MHYAFVHIMNNYAEVYMVLLRAVGVPPPPKSCSLQANGYDWAARVRHSSAFIYLKLHLLI